MSGRGKWLILVGGVCLALLWAATPAGAQSRALYWRRWDVSIDEIDTRANRFHISEIHEIQFTSGTFRFGFRSILWERMEGIENVAVYEGETPLARDCGGSAGTFCAVRVGDEFQITYYFLTPATNERRTFVVEYDVVGGLRSYEGGDQLNWFVIAPDHSFPVKSSTITVRMPQGFAPRPDVDPVVSYGPPTTVTVQDTLVTFTTTREIGADEGLEIRIQYPHDPQGRMSLWQANYDRQAAYDENVRPLLNLLFGGAGLLLLILGPLAVYYLWYRRGRDPEIGVVPEYLAAPPSDLPPAIVGVLVDEKADLQDVMSTLLDLARRGYMVIEEDRQPGVFGFGSSVTYTFKRTDKPDSDLRSYERYMLSNIFGNADERALDSLRYRFYTIISRIQDELYREVVNAGFFTANPERVRQRWAGLGIVLIVLAVMSGVVLLGLDSLFVEAVICLPIALGIVGIAVTVASGAMPARTAKGAEEAAKWKAFREYLRNIRKYTDVEQATDQFNDYLPYAVAFGLERTWVNTFSRVPRTPIPYWYYPRYLGGPWGGGYHRGGPMVDMRDLSGTEIGDRLARPDFSLDRAAGGMFGGLERMSSGLFGMLDSASRVFTSVPQQSATHRSSGSWSRSGRSWSGGGFRGGGGGGGRGRAGFG